MNDSNQMGELITYEIDYGEEGEPSPERFQVTAGSQAEIMVKGYVEANGYEIREIEREGGAS